MDNQADSLQQSLDAAQASLPDVGLIILAILTLLVVVYSLLVSKQISQMTRVLPTTLSPHIKTIGIGYTICALGTLIAILLFTFS